jgi:hypothetical protein
LLTLYMIYLVNSFSSRFPKQAVLTGLDLAAARFSAKLTENGIELVDNAYEPSKWDNVRLGSSTKQAIAAGEIFVAKSPGLKLAGNSFGLLQGAAGFGSLNNLQTGDIKDPKISLSLQHSYVVFIEANELVAWAKEGTTFDCDLLVVVRSVSIDTGAVYTSLIGINDSLIAARESIKNTSESTSSLANEDSGFESPPAINNVFGRLASAFKSRSNKEPKLEKPEKDKKPKKSQEPENPAPQVQALPDDFDPFK